MIDIGSQFETFSSRAGRTPQRLLPTRSRSTRPRNSNASTIVGTDGARYYDGSSTDSSSTEMDAFSEDGLDDEDHDGMNYHLILHQNRANEPAPTETLVQESKFYFITICKLISFLKLLLLCSSSPQVTRFKKMERPQWNGRSSKSNLNEPKI